MIEEINHLRDLLPLLRPLPFAPVPFPFTLRPWAGVSSSGSGGASGTGVYSSSQSASSTVLKLSPSRVDQSRTDLAK